MEEAVERHDCGLCYDDWRMRRGDRDRRGIRWDDGDSLDSCCRQEEALVYETVYRAKAVKQTRCAQLLGARKAEQVPGRTLT